jgi:two-component system, chemotaxis family, sensor kinase CheA
MIPPQLNDAAFVVVQLRATELHEIKALRDSLRHFAVFDANAASQVRAHAQQAATLLNLLVLGGVEDGEQLLAQASAAIDAAITAAESADLSTPEPASADLTVVVRDSDSTSALHSAMTVSAPLLSAPLPRVTAATAQEVTRAAAPDGGRIPHDSDLSLLSDFIAESRESIAGAESALLSLESNPDDPEAINTVFRAFHTVKGTSAFLGLDRLSDFAHHVESLLSRVRERELAYSQGVASLSLRAGDALSQFLDAIELSAQTHEVIALPTDFAALMRDLLDVDAVLSRTVPAASPATLTATTADDGAFDSPPLAASVPGADATSRRSTPPPGVGKSDADLSVRVRTDRLDRLIDMVGELVIAQSMIAADTALFAAGQHDLMKKVVHAGKIMRELQDLSMSMRMLPLKSTFQKLTRLVRDVALRAGKVVELVTVGDETELDRNMVDAIADPLVHMVRNAVDHGIESPEDRARLGKPRAGRLQLAAFQQGGKVIVELRDDGRGLNRDRILAKAIEKGLVPVGHSLSESETYALIFAPGFSTAETLTDISGRGVGMDVVRRNVESIRGRIDTASEVGKGTTFQIRLPLTLAVTDGMLVRVADERYIVPLTSIALSFRPSADMLSTIPPRGEVVMLRGEVLPVVRLHRVFGIEGAVTDPSAAILMIVGDGEHRVALLVDQLLGQQQVVAKALGDGVGEVPGISGGAILSDGRVGLIVDIAQLTLLARTGNAGPRHMAHAA